MSLQFASGLLHLVQLESGHMHILHPVIVLIYTQNRREDITPPCYILLQTLKDLSTQFQSLATDTDLALFSRPERLGRETVYHA